MNNKIIGLIVGLLLFAGIGFGVWKKQHPDLVKTEITVPNSEKSAPPIESSLVSHESAQINLPERPVNGVYKGVIEVGASGFNCFVVNIDKDKKWELVSKTFGESLAIEGFATVEDVHNGMKKYLSEIFTKGVAGRNVHFVMSSGALKLKNNQLIADAIAKKGFIVNKVDATQEGKYGAKCLLSPEYRSKSYVVDIGSGNTKITWYEGSAMKSLEGPGAKYYQDGPLHLTDDQAYAKIKELASQIPAANRGTCFIIGGVPFQFAKKTRSDNERYTILKSPDEYSAGDDVKLKSGINIYNALIDATGTSTFVFDWDANFTIGFLLSLN
jgi:hypothetical protein